MYWLLCLFLGLKVDSFSGYIGRTIVDLSSCSILVYTIHYPILSLLYMKTDLFVHTDFPFLFGQVYGCYGSSYLIGYIRYRMLDLS